MMLSIVRILKFGFKNYFRNIWLSIAATSVMVLAIISVSILIMLNWVGDMTLDMVKDKVDISIYMNTDVSGSQINQVRNKLLSLSEVKTINFISKDEALRDFQKKHEENDLVLSSVLELDENPLQPTLVVRARNPEDYSVISANIEIDEFKDIVDKVNYEDNKEVIGKLNGISENIRKIGLAVSLIFSFLVVLVVANTIRLTIYTQKEEIKIMKLVGATNRFIRTPFVIEGALYGIFGSILSFTLLYPMVKYFSPILNNFLEDQGVDIFSYYSEHMLMILIFEIALGVILGTISSFWAVRRYLKV